MNSREMNTNERKSCES